jgi:transcriptional regulator with XRE-family HTH domain
MKKDQLCIAVNHANKLLKKINEKYDKLKIDLVFSSQAGQCKLTTDLIEILKQFPDMVEDSDNKKFGLKLIEQISRLENDKKDVSQPTKDKIEKLSHELNEFEDCIVVKKETFIELRFSQQNLEQIFEMQKDPLISQKYTPQSRASIRIVLGTLDELYQDSEKLI